MAEQIVHADIRFAGSVGFNKNYTDFPANPRPQMMIVKGGIPYMYADLGSGFFSWFPMATKQSAYIHSQGIAAEEWTLNHSLGSVSYGLFAYDENHTLMVANHEPVDANTVKAYFASAVMGSAVIFAVETFSATAVVTSQTTIGDILLTDDGQGNLDANGNDLAYKQFVIDGLALKSNVTDVFASLALKSDKTSVDASLALKANSADVYLKTDTLTAVQTNAAIQAVVDAAPEALNTLREIALEMQADQSAAGALTALVATKASSIDLVAEKARAEGAESALLDAIGSLNTISIAAVTDLASETARAEGVEAVLQAGVNVNAADIIAETTRAEAAEALLATQAQVNAAITGVITTYSYDNRASLRAVEAGFSLIESLGLFKWVAGSTEPDDDETAFKTATGVWELVATDPDTVFASWLASFDTLQANIDDIAAKQLFGSFAMTLTSLNGATSSDFTATVLGAVAGDTVMVTPGNSFGTSGSDRSRLSYTAYVSAANTVTISIRNASAAIASMTASTWSILIIKR